jgi:hypothetical protein
MLPASGLGVSPQIQKVPQDWGIRGLIKKSLCVIASEAKQSKRVQWDFPLVGAWGCPPAFKKSPKTGGYRALIKTIPAVSNCKNGLSREGKVD